MAINFKSKFGGNVGVRGNRDDLPKAQFWMNIGYTAEFQNEDGEPESRFVSFPQGIPLDTMEKLATTARNQQFAQFQSARNDLLEQVLDATKDLEPGEERLIDTGSILQIQVRRVNAELPAVERAENPFVRALALA